MKPTLKTDIPVLTALAIVAGTILFLLLASLYFENRIANIRREQMNPPYLGNQHERLAESLF